MRKLITECTDYDFKIMLEVNKPKSWLKSVSAYANGLGGSLFFGVNNDGEVVGLENIKTVGEKISELIKARINPIPNFELIPNELEGMQYLEVVVYSGTNTPYYYDSDGVKEAYIRFGDQTIIAPNYTLNELILKGTNRTFDQLVTRHIKSDYSFTFFEATFLEKTHTHINENDYISFGLADENGYLTNAGVLLADQNIFFFNRVFCTKWNGLDKTSLDDDAVDDAEFSGSIIKLLYSALDFVKRNTKKRWRKEADYRKDMPEYDELAVREAIVNALIHRSYTITGAEVSVNIYDDRLEVVSPGTLLSGEKLSGTINKRIPSLRRNPALADVFARMNFMERRGSGLKKITDRTNALFADNENHVRFFSDNIFFKTVIYNANYNIKTVDDTNNVASDVANNVANNVVENVVDDVVDDVVDKLSETERQVLDILYSDRLISAEQLAAKIGKAQRTIQRALASLKKKGYIERIGTDRNGKWNVIKK